MSHEPSFRDRLERLRVLTVERGHASKCAEAMTYSNVPCTCGKDAPIAPPTTTEGLK